MSIKCHLRCIAFLLTISLLSGCGGGGSSAPETTAAPATTAATEATTTTAESTMEAAATTAAPETKPKDLPIEPKSKMYDINSKLLTAALPYSDGIAWIQYLSDTNNTITAAIDADGNILFTLDEQNICYCSDFQDGYAFYAVDDDTIIYKSTYSGHRLTHEIIIDEEGNELYCTKQDSASDIKEEHILCYGDNRFVALRHISNMTTNQWYIGTIDAQGNTIDEFQEFDDGDSYLNFANLQKQLNTTYSYYYLEPLDIQTTPKIICVSRYLGEGVYCLNDSKFSSKGCFYRAGQGIMARFEEGVSDSGLFPLGIANNKFIMGKYRNGGRFNYLKIFDHNGSRIKELDSYSADYIGQKTAPRYAFKDDMFYYRKGYYDVDLNLVRPVDLYPDLAVWCHPFYHGYAIVQIKGQDEELYMTVINEQMEEQFEPMPCLSVSGEIINGYFLAERKEGKWVTMNVRGKYPHSLTRDFSSVVSVTPAGEGYTLIGYEHNGNTYYAFYSVREAAKVGKTTYEWGEIATAKKNSAEESQDSSSKKKDYTFISNFSIEGKWKSVGEYGFGQAQPGAIVVFDGTNANFFSPQDTYAVYQDGDVYKLDATSFMSTSAVTLTIKTIDADHIDLFYGDQITELERINE